MILPGRTMRDFLLEGTAAAQTACPPAVAFAPASADGAAMGWTVWSGAKGTT
jgi:hypothetical protein